MSDKEQPAQVPTSRETSDPVSELPNQESLVNKVAESLVKLRPTQEANCEDPRPNTFI